MCEWNRYLAWDNNSDEPGWFIQWLQERELVRAFTFEEAWFDIGTPESYLDAIAWHLDGDNCVHPDAELDNVDLGSKVQVLAGAHLEATTIDESVVFPETTIKSCELRRSLVDQDTHIESLNLSGAIIGDHIRLNGNRH